ncbi:helix-turn-helix domain-containing protein [Mycoplasmatota bacterium zrk1]
MKRSVYLYMKDYNQLIVDTFSSSNNQFTRFEKKDKLIVFEEEVIEDFDYEVIKDLLEVDFKEKLTLVVGGDFEIVNKYIKDIPNDVYYLDDFFVHLISINKGKDLFTWLNSFDSELIYTVNKFIENDLSVNKTASTLYIHRNTLNYRLDKFNKLSGLNIRSFKGSLAVYLILNFVQTAN